MLQQNIPNLAAARNIRSKNTSIGTSSNVLSSIRQRVILDIHDPSNANVPETERSYIRDILSEPYLSWSTYNSKTIALYEIFCSKYNPGLFLDCKVKFASQIEDPWTKACDDVLHTVMWAPSPAGTQPIPVWTNISTVRKMSRFRRSLILYVTIN